MYRSDKLRAEAAKLRLSNQDIANITGLARQTVGLVLDGEVKDIKLSTLEAVTTAVGLQLSDVFEPQLVAA